MKTFKLSWEIFKREFKKYHMLCITMIFAITSSFVFFDIMNYESKLYRQIKEFKSLAESFPFSTILGFIVMLFCGFMIMNSYIYLLKRETKEFAIMTISGATNIQSTKYLIYQTLFIIALSFPLGIIVGYLLSLVCRITFSHFFSINISLLSINPNTLSNTFITTIIILLIIIVYSSGYIYRNKIIDLINDIHSKQVKDKRLLRFPHWIYPTIYFFGIYVTATSTSTSSIFFGSLVGILGSGGTIQYILPNLLAKHKKNYAMSNSIKIISLSFLSDSLQKSIKLISTYCVFSVAMLSLVISKINNMKDFTIAVIGYIIVLILISFTIMYKFINDSITRKNSLFYLYQLGYEKYQIIEVIIHEVISYFVFITLIPLIYEIIILIMSYNQKLINFSTIIILLVIIILPMIIVTIISSLLYKNNIINDIEENISYE